MILPSGGTTDPIQISSPGDAEKGLREDRAGEKISCPPVGEIPTDPAVLPDSFK